MKVNGGRMGPPSSTEQFASAGDARSIAALLLGAKVAVVLGITLEPGELQGTIEVLIEQSRRAPAPRDYDEVAAQMIAATRAYQNSRGGPTVVETDGSAVA